MIVGKIFIFLLFFALAGGLHLVPRVAVSDGHSGAAEASLQALSQLRTRWEASVGQEASFFYADRIIALYFSQHLLARGLQYVDWLALHFPDLRGYERSAYWYDRAHQMVADGEQKGYYAAQARHYYQLVLADCPEDTDTKVREALTYLSSETPMQAIFLLREVLQKEPAHPRALYHLGLLSFETGQYKKAIHYLGLLVAVRPLHEEAALYLGRAHLMDGDRKRGGALLRRLKETSINQRLVQEAGYYLGVGV